MARHRNFHGQGARDLEDEFYYDRDTPIGVSVEDDMPLTPESSRFFRPPRHSEQTTPQLCDYFGNDEDADQEDNDDNNASGTTFHFDEDNPMKVGNKKGFSSRAINTRAHADSGSSEEAYRLDPTPPTSFKTPLPVKPSGGKKTLGFNPPPRRPNAVADFVSVGEIARLQIEEKSDRTRSVSPAYKSPMLSPQTQKTKTSGPGPRRTRRKSLGLKDMVNLVVIGHVDAGKSTLMGHLLYKLGNVNQKQMHKFRQESQKIGKGSFAFAWVLDESNEERARGITMDVARTRFETNNKSIVLLDAPGHKDFIPNMISGAAQADAAVLVVNATRGEFETGFDAGGQTREHAMLVRSLGVSQLAVAINKLDTVDWDESRFSLIKDNMKQFLKQAGFQPASVTFVPVCGLGGENLTEPPSPDHPLSKWYQGPTLLDIVDGFDSPSRGVDMPLRFSVSDVFKGQSSGFVVSGKVETGSVANGDKVIVMPAAETAQVKGVQTDEGLDGGTGFAGDQCLLSLTGASHPDNIATGNVLCHLSEPISPCTRFEIRVVLFNLKIPLTKGFPVVVHCHCACEAGNVHKLKAEVNKVNGEVVKNKPRCLSKNSSGVIEIVTERPICIEKYSDCKQIGRVTLRASGATIGAGVVTLIHKQ